MKKDEYIAMTKEEDPDTGIAMEHFNDCQNVLQIKENASLRMQPKKNGQLNDYEK